MAMVGVTQIMDAAKAVVLEFQRQRKFTNTASFTLQCACPLHSIELCEQLNGLLLSMQYHAHVVASLQAGSAMKLWSEQRKPVRMPKRQGTKTFKSTRDDHASS
jgi:hypothetical protein